MVTRSLPMSSLASWDAYTLAELEYLAENELIEITPRLRVDEPLQLLSVGAGARGRASWTSAAYA